MNNPRIVVALLAASVLGLTASAITHAQDTADGDGSQQTAKTTETDRQQRRADRAERREQRQRSAAAGDGNDTAATDTTARQQRREQRRAERAERRESRRASSGRSEAGQHARWRDQRSHRDFNRRDFGHARSNERRRVGQGRRWDGERPRARHRTSDDRVDRRLAKQRARTRAGWEDGEVTHRELRRIRKDQRKIARMDRRFGSDGRYTKRERRKLNKALDRASDRVYRVKHNDRTKHRAFDDRVDRRLAKQRTRARAGWKNGEVTHREAKRIRRDQRKIVRMDRRFGSDGRYTKRERRKLNKALDRASDRVYRAKHNHRVAGDARKRRW